MTATDRGPAVAAATIEVAAGDTETITDAAAADGVVTTTADAILYSPGADGRDTLSYLVTDELGDSVTASTTPAVDPGPVVAAGGSLVHAGAKVSLTAALEAEITAGLAGDSETITAISASAGTVALANGAVTYTAPASGSAVLTYTVTDQLGDTATGTYVVTITPAVVQGLVLHFGAATDPGWGGGEGNIVVTLLDAAGHVLATTTTRGNGWFDFTSLQVGTYQLEYTLPAGQIIEPGSSGVSASTLLSAPFTLTAGENFATAAADVISVASFTGEVELDGTGEAGVVIDLLLTVDTLWATTTTDANGAFSFTDVPVGSYMVRYIPPDGQGLLAGGPASIASGITGTYTVVQAQVESLPTQVLSTSATPPEDPVAQQPTQLTFDDEFNSFVWSADGSSGWMTEYPYGGESARALPNDEEAEYYSDPTVGTDPFSLQNGVLDITATPAAPGSNPYGLPYTSGIITTYRSMAQTYGLFEARVEMPAGQGLWPSFWLLPAGAYTSELDVFEVLGSAPGVLYSTSHSLVDGVWSGDSQVRLVPDTSTGFHVYAVDWEPTLLSFYVDGNLIATIPTPAAMDQPMYMILNLTVGGAGSWPGAPDATTVFPATMQVDWVRVYATANTIDVSGTAAIESSSVSGTASLDGSPEAGVVVALIDAGGNTIATATTDATGAFSFTGLAAGDYQLGYTAPDGTVLSSTGQASVATGLIGTFNLADGQALALPDEALVAAATVTATVTWLAGGTTTGEGGVAVALLDATGATVATGVSAADGSVSFTGLYAGTYQLEYTVPAGQVVEPGGAVAAATGLTADFTVAAGQTLAAPACVLLPMGSISGVVDFAGTGAGGITLTLLDGTGAVLATAVTGADGSFDFANLAAGTYQVEYSLAASEVLLAGGPADPASLLTAPIVLGRSTQAVLATAMLAPAPATIAGSVVFEAGGQAGVAVTLLASDGSTVASTQTDADGDYSFTGLAAGGYELSFTPPAGEMASVGGLADPASDLTVPQSVTAGQTLELGAETLAPLTGTLLGTVTEGGAGEAGVAVALLGAAGSVLATTTTDAAGDFAFTGLAAGSYAVSYTAPAGTELPLGGPASPSTGATAPVSLAADQILTLASQTLLNQPAWIQAKALHFGASGDPPYGSGIGGMTVALLDSTGAVIATAVTQGNGWFAFYALAAGSYQLRYTPPAGETFVPGGAVDPTTDLTAPFSVAAGQAAIAPSAALENLASLAGEVTLGGVGEAGVAVSLLDGDGDLIATTTTASDGTFSFTGLAAGTYQVEYAAPAGTMFGVAGFGVAGAAATGSASGGSASGGSASGGSASGTALSDSAAAGSVAADSAVSGGAVSGGAAAPSVGGTGAGTPVTVLLGAPVTLALGQAETLAPVSLQSALASIAGSVTLDGGVVAGVVVSLLNAAGQILAKTRSAADGSFSFSGLAAGIYQVSFTPPRGSVPQTGSTANAATWLTPQLNATAGQVVSVAPEALLTQPGAIQGVVAHFGGVGDPAYGGGDGGVTVALVGADGSVLATTVTHGNGWYIFRYLAAGSYRVMVTPPSGQIIRPAGAADPATGLTAAVAVPAGSTVAAPQIALVSGFVMTGSGLSVSAGDGNHLVTGTASQSTLVLGAGNQSVTLTGTADAVVTGNGNQTISLAGTGNSVSVGTGTSTIFAGSGDASVQAAGGWVKITAGGSGNLFDGGAGVSFMYADGSAGNVFMLNAGGASLLTTIAGFTLAGQDTLGLARTLAGATVPVTLANLGQFVTASISGGDTLLAVDPSGGAGVPRSFAVLSGVHTSVAALLAAGDFALQ